ncbi:MAG: membrane protein insertase YidC [Candidatus Kapaibacterium sp.]|nr:MAG: membrane protein insertase YidC [Candidatus Kapabacteria bacterium]
MERKQFIGFLLIGLIIAGYMTWTSVQQAPPKTPQQKQQDSLARLKASSEQALQDSSANTTKGAVQNQGQTQAQTQNSSNPNHSKFGALYEPFRGGRDEVITVENDLLQARISSRGGTLRAWRLKKYLSWYGDSVQLIPFENKFGALGISFRDMNDGQAGTSRESNIVDTRELNFTLQSPQGAVNKVSGNDSLVIVASVKLANGGVIERKYTFYGNRYHTNLAVRINGMNGMMSDKYSLQWRNGLQYQEQNSVEESSQAKAWLAQNGTQSEVDAGAEPAPVSANGTLDFAAIKSKYFVAAIQPTGALKNEMLQASLTGYKQPMPNEGNVEKYDMKIDVPYSQNRVDTYSVYIGPIEYDILKEYKLESAFNFANQMILGLQYLIRPIGEYMILPLLRFVYKFIPNYGLAIIIFSLLMKLLLQPLTASQTESMQKMQILQPEMEKIKSKYKDDMQKQQQETMKLYSEYGINPAGGCLPLLLQMPILIALYNVFSSVIDLRQTPFIGWITDLSVPDELLRLPFKLPLINIDIISGLALSMGLTMFAQQYMTVKDPQQRAMVYMMPVMMTFAFANLPAGLTLYYFMFNIMSVAQQVWATKFSKNKMTLADLKKAPKKEGWLQKKMREAQNIAAAQGRTIPGQAPELPSRTDDKRNDDKKKNRK